MSKFQYIFLGSFLVLSALLFQNCGEMSGSTSESSSQTSSTLPSDETQPEIQETFKAGDPFDKDLIPITITDDYFKNRVSWYAGNENLKALAISAIGKGSVVVSKNADDQDDINRAAMESCQLASEGFPCVLIAAGNEFKYDSSKLAENYAFAIRDTTTFEAMKIPGFLNIWKRAHSMSGEPWGYARKSASFQAMAIGINGNADHSTSLESQAEANRRAIEACEKRKYTPSCILYAEGNKVVFNSNNFQMPEQKIIAFAPSALDPMKVPFVRDNARSGHIKTAYDKIASEGKDVVIAISIYGHYWALVGDNANQAFIDQAVDNCNGTLPSGSTYSCFVYSVNNDVVMTQESLDASY